MDNPYDMSYTELLELDWRAEQRAEARFLLDTYADQTHFGRIDIYASKCCQMRPNAADSGEAQ